MNRTTSLGYHLGTSTRALGRRASDLRHPGAAWAVAVLHDGRTLMPEVAGPLAPGDWLYLVAKSVCAFRLTWNDPTL
ncbi:MAG: hypothetical protein EOM22_05385 [Gammaproteobacteria bacterium]|nr:hypothetical protein [Gammaproteobacteria bacterium]